MRADDTPEEVAAPPRPLPSVDIPLLRHERRAGRQVRMIWTGVGATLVLVAAGVAYLNRHDSADDPASAPPPPMLESPAADASVGVDASLPAPAEVPEAPAVALQRAPEGGTRLETTFGSARGFRPALLAAGLDNDDAAELETALQGTIDFRRCHPTDVMIINRDADGGLHSFEYHASRRDYVLAERDAHGQLHAEHRERPLDVTPLARGGVIHTSLGEALEALGLGRTLVGSFVEVFDGRVNFQRATRVGDRFKILVDEERLDGELWDYAPPRALEFDGQRTGRVRAFYFAPEGRRGDYYDEDGRSMRGGWLRTPLHYDHISSPFDMHRMHPILHRIQPHNGVDYAAGTGTPVWAAAGGTVIWAGPKGANGNLVGLRHQDGYATWYAHLSYIAPGIRRGATVEHMQRIGLVGTTGRSTGPHLHFGLKRGTRFVDPLPIINGPGALLPAGLRGPFRRVQRELTAALDAIDAGPAPASQAEPSPHDDPAPIDVPLD